MCFEMRTPSKRVDGTKGAARSLINDKYHGIDGEGEGEKRSKDRKIGRG